MSDIHIGEEIAARLDELGMTKAEFGRRINTSRQNINTILKKPSLDAVTLVQISNVLGVNLLDRFSQTVRGNSPMRLEREELVKIIREEIPGSYHMLPHIIRPLKYRPELPPDGPAMDRYRFPAPRWKDEPLPDPDELPPYSAIYLRSQPNLQSLNFEPPAKEHHELERHNSLHFIAHLLKTRLGGSEALPRKRVSALESNFPGSPIQEPFYSFYFKGADIDLSGNDANGFRIYGEGEKECYILRVEDEIHAALRLCELRYATPLLTICGRMAQEGKKGEIYALQGPWGESIGVHPNLKTGIWREEANNG